MDQQKHTDLMIKQGELDHSWIKGYISSGGKSNDEAIEAFIKAFGRKPVNMDKYNGKRICTPEDNCMGCPLKA